MTLPGGTASTYALSYYPNSNQLQSITNEDGEVVQRGADLDNGDTRYILDPLNQARESSNQDYVAGIYNRDTAGNVTSTQENWYGAGTDLESDPFPSPQSSLRGSSYTYGTGGLVTSVTDPEGNVTNLSYDVPKGYLTGIDSPAGSGESSRRETTITYNADGGVRYVIDPEGQKVRYNYDYLGRLYWIRYYKADATLDHSIQYTLDPNGNITGMTDNTGSSSWTYDENNRITSESRTQNGVTRTAHYSYYPDGLLASETTFNGQTVSYDYDEALRLTSQTDPNDGGGTISYGYDTRSRLTSITYPSGVSQHMNYDKGSRLQLETLKQSDGTILQSFDYYYGFDTNGNRQSDYYKGDVVSVTELDGSETTYSYDDLNRLVEAVRTGTSPYTESYTYDLNNNRTSITKNGTTTNATYDDANQMTSLGSTSYSYDRDGNLTSFGGNTLTYDAANKWTGGTVNGNSVSFGYDGLGRRVSSTFGTAATREYWYDQSGLSLETATDGDNIVFLRTPSGRLLSRWFSPVLVNYGMDRLGSITALTGTDQSLQHAYNYRPYGDINYQTGGRYNPYRYTGTYYDSQTALYQMGARYYDQSAGRFTQQDPSARSILSKNRYAYVGCNPVNATDSTGMFTMTGECWDFVIDATSVAIDLLPIPGASFLKIPVEDAITAILTSGSASVDIAQEDPQGVAMDIAFGTISFVPVVGDVISTWIDSMSALMSLSECMLSQP